MSPAELKEETYLPGDGGQLAQVYDFMVAHAGAGRGPIEPRYLLAGAAPGESVELPANVYLVLRQVVEAMRCGLAVTVAPQTQTLTTQQAADLLGISRPTLIRLLNEGRIPFERAGSHRRLLLRNVLSYRDQRREEQYRALAATSVDVDEEEDIEAVLASLREVRREVAGQRRAPGPAH